MERNKNTDGIYIYGIIPNFYSTEMFRSLLNTGIYTISYQNISAIVSERKNVPFDSLDREKLGHLLVNHQKTLEDLAEKGFNMIIPMRLGSMANSKEEVAKMLANGLDLIMETFNKIEHMVEIDLAVTWADFPAIIKEVASHPEIVALKEEILKKGEAISQIDQVKIGMLLEEKIKEKNETVELDIMNSLSAFCKNIKRHEVMNDQMITNSAYLIKRNKKEKFEQELDRLDEEYKGMLNFKMVGPLPCYSFYTIEVKELNLEHVLQAKKDLGLNETTSESEIKKAYQEKAKEFHPDTYPGADSTEIFNRINKAFHTMTEYVNAVKPNSREEAFSLQNEAFKTNSFFLKIKE